MGMASDTTTGKQLPFPLRLFWKARIVRKHILVLSQNLSAWNFYQLNLNLSGAWKIMFDSFSTWESFNILR